MPKQKKYIVLSTGYRIERDDPQLANHIIAAIVGETVTHHTLDPNADPTENVSSLASNIYRECLYLYTVFGINLAVTLHGSINLMWESITQLEREELSTQRTN
jgi:hypothetical protein